MGKLMTFPGVYFIENIIIYFKNGVMLCKILQKLEC